mmetsp:Transcript_22623/g.34174  ORF Transcript_22623/g.34174 Transcript_22623/m.34174 type:complete len:1098 (-) Transcript_22623:181-3474(-)|eukprot:CAMPEP_0178925068 /NCGR_PEP_ID=MMETSP0786-20121207/17690_1 /TAXON_ID=186022 /ORGANISM="Thalassionema frauenfeldii, Strain CCMP 1798" /LENGTH=1097 /DNA_ID=CAMNT_0020599875 /DNA_START=290 /DNA_END=3583 /DNA_ORIENTATION=-
MAPSSSFKPSSSASHKIYDMTKYFSPSPKKRRRSIERKENDTYINGVARKRQRPLSGSVTSPIYVDDEVDNKSTILEIGVALIRINDSKSMPSKQLARAGDPNTYLLHDKAILGRSLAPCSNSQSIAKKFRNQKIDLGIHSATSGVSRKQLEILKLEPLTFKQLKGVTNQVSVQKYNAVKKTMEERKIVPKGAVFSLKFNDVIFMDALRKGRNEHCFRVQKCVTPPLRSKKQNLNSKIDQNPKNQLVDLVHSASVIYSSASTSNNKALNKSRIFSDRQRISTTVGKYAKNDMKTKISLKKQTKVSNESLIKIVRDKENNNANSLPQDGKTLRTLPSSSTKLSNENLSSSKPITLNTHSTGTNIVLSQSKIDKSCENKHRSKDDIQDIIKQREGATKTSCATEVHKEKPMNTEDELQKQQNKTRARNVLPRTPKNDDSSDVSKTKNNIYYGAVTSRSPEVGDFFRVLYKTNDTFEVDGNERFYESWHLGQVEKVTTCRKQASNGGSLYKLKLKFPDKTRRELEFPGNDIQMIDRSDESGISYALVPQGSNVYREKVFDRNPEKLMVGDLVDAYYQNGLDSDKWYRGRIASVNTSSNLCTVAYDDGDIECLVPMKDGKITLVEKGCVHSKWLLNLGIYDDFDRKRKRKNNKTPSIEIGVVTEIENEDEDVKIIITFHSGVKTGLCYSEFVAYLFESLLSRYESTKTWPTIDSVSWKSKPEKQGEGNVKETSLKKQKRSSQSKKMPQKFCEEEWRTNKVDVPCKEHKIQFEYMKEMHSILSNSLFRALNTSEPLLGADLLMHTALFHDRGMNPNLGQKIRELLVDGPTSEGTNFPDSHRLEATMRYLKILSHTKEGCRNLTKFCCPAEWSPFQEMIRAIVEPCYAYDDDMSLTNLGALHRMSDSLHLGAVGAQFLAKLFAAELDEYVDQRKLKKNAYRELFIAKAMWSNEDGPRQSLKELSKAFVHAWVNFGHYAVCKLPVETDTALSTLRRKCREDSKLLLKDLGAVMSYAIWLYSIVEDVRLNNKDLAYIIKDTFQSESIASQSDLSAYVKSKGDYSSYKIHLKLELILSLDPKLIADVQTNLAKELGVQREYTLVVG